MKKYLLFLLVISFWHNAYSQSADCENIGFELGNFNGWSFTTGDVIVNSVANKVQYTNEIQGQNGNGAVITSAFSGNDTNVWSQNIPQLAPGSSYSCRLGQNYENTGGKFYRLTTNFTVTPEHNLFLYKFAVVLQDFDNHLPVQKPGFSLELLDSKGESVACSEFDVQLVNRSNVLKYFNLQGDIQFMNWINGAIDLKNYIGQKITLRATAHGCTRVRHYGYAYFDAQCVKAEIKQISKCPDDDGLVSLKGPEGFGEYIWNDGKNELLHKVDPIIGQNYTVSMKPLFAIDNTCELQLDHTIKYTKLDTTINLTLCEGEVTKIGTENFNTTGNYVRQVRLTPICDSTVTLNLKVNKIGRHSFSKIICDGENLAVGDSIYTKSGTYVTTINRGILCDSIITSTLHVDKKIDANFGESFITINKGDSLFLNSGISTIEPYTYNWNVPSLLSCSNCPAAWTSPKRSELYTLNVTNPNRSCFSDDSVFVRVEPCAVHAPDIFTPNTDTGNDLFQLFAGSCVEVVLSWHIYNRWGELLYSASNFHPADGIYGWNGSYKGQLLEPDVYPFKAVYRLRGDPTLRTFQHAVTLVR